MTTQPAPLLKDALNAKAMALIGHAAVQAEPSFNLRGFVALACRGLAPLSIMQRMNHAADSLQAYLPSDYPRALQIVRRMAPHLPGGFVAMVLPAWVGRHGLDHLPLSLEALQALTPYSTSEFALRGFLARDPDCVLAWAQRWAEDDNAHVRRLASEGLRPRLPWAPRLSWLSAAPHRVQPVLERLHADPSAYVRRSVANHLNDISKEHPDWVLDLLERWPRQQTETQRITRHALRNLVKAGHPRALTLVGATLGAEVALTRFSVAPATLCLGQTLQLTVTLTSTADHTQHVVVDYAIHYVKQSGETRRKVFKLRTLALPSRAELSLRKNQTVTDFTTRIHYPGQHRVELLVNGQVMAEGHFDLKRPRP